MAAAKRTDRRHDLVAGPIMGTLLAFALPMLGSNILQSLNGSINAVWVGQFLGETGLAATSNANLIMFMMFALVFGFGMASSIMVGQSMGRGDLDGARRGVGAGMGFFALLGVTSATIGWLGSPALLHLMGTPADVHPQALTYLRVMFLGMPAGLLTTFLGMSLRGMGDSLTPLMFMIPGAMMDAGLNPVFILGLGPAPRLGIAGAGTATLIANWASFLALLLFIYLRDLPVRLRGRELGYLWPARALVNTIVVKGVPMGLQMIVGSISGLVMIGLVNRQGTATVAAYGAANQLWTYIQMPALAISGAVSTMAAQNIGAGRWDRVGAITRAGVIINLLLSGSAVVAVTLVDHPVLGLFLGGDRIGVAIASHINLLASWSFMLMGVVLALSAVMRANGAVVAPLVIMAVAFLPGRLGAAYLLEPVIGGDAIWWSFPLSAAFSTLLTAGYYWRGGWRELRLLAPPGREEVEEFTQSEAEPLGRDHPNG
jgi:putative MATE family efflux protein